MTLVLMNNVLDKIFKLSSIGLFIVALHGTFVFFGMTKSNPLDYFKDEKVQVISSDIDYVRNKLDRVEIEIRIIEDKKARELHGLEGRMAGQGPMYIALQEQSKYLQLEQLKLWEELKILQAKRDEIMMQKTNKAG